MSRHELPAKRPGTSVVIGWDNPMMTFFAQVFDEQAEEGTDPVLLWIGTRHGEVTRREDLAKPLTPFAELTAPQLEQLRADRAADLDRGPSPLQRFGSLFGRETP
ncbi:hypothetical protein QMO56_18975 [Roseomonas sp. E05]|uniref:hypothetical protein n=1 Tax=Roseomonas sp. E05 TaxID=3046310 RepID=UPI0024BB9A42|nr:hypothetical protein [Roseomonas sp. E05]MDJ0390198.1 hypothetical protein [Roseomonas sp. E05]